MDSSTIVVNYGNFSTFYPFFFPFIFLSFFSILSLQPLIFPLLLLGQAKMLQNGVIMDVTNVEQALIAQKAGACAVMALEKIPADIRKEGGVARMTDPQVIKNIFIIIFSFFMSFSKKIELNYKQIAFKGHNFHCKKENIVKTPL